MSWRRPQSVRSDSPGSASPPHATGARGAGTAGVIAGTPRVHGPRADRADEPVDRFAQRPVRPRRHAVRTADRRPPVHRRPTRWSGCTATSRRLPVPPAERLEEVPGAVSAVIMKLLAKTAEDRYQTAAGLERDLRRCLAAWEAHAPDRRLPARRTRHAGPAADPREAVRAGARDRNLARRLRSRGIERQAGAGAGLRLFRHRQVLRRPRAAPGARSAARPLRFGQIRPVQARHPVFDARAGLSEPYPSPSE